MAQLYEEGPGEEMLPCELTEGEKRQRGERMAQMCLEISELDEQRKLEVARFKEQIGTCVRERERCATEIREGGARRPVPIFTQKNLSAGTMETYRTDTGVRISERSLSHHERKGQLFPMDQGAADAPPARDESPPT